MAVDRTMKLAHPPMAPCGDEVWRLVACAVPPVLAVKTRRIESLEVVIVLFAASFTHTVIVDCDAPLAGMGFGDAVAKRWLAAPVPVNEMVAEAGVSPLDVAVAVHDSTSASLIVNFTVVPNAAVLAVAGLPPPPAGVVLRTVAPHVAELFGWLRVNVIAVVPKNLLPPASCTCTVTSQLELLLDVVVGVFEHVLPMIASLDAGPDAVTEAMAEPLCTPGMVAVIVQLPGAPVVVRVAVAVLAPAGMVVWIGETLQIPPLSTLKVTVWLVCAVVVAPLESFNVAVMVVV